MKMISQFKLVGISSPRSGTLELLHTDRETFWAPFAWTDEKFAEFFRWADDTPGFWRPGWIAEVQHEGLYEDGTPRKPIILSLQEAQQNGK